MVLFSLRNPFRGRLKVISSASGGNHQLLRLWDLAPHPHVQIRTMKPLCRLPWGAFETPSQGRLKAFSSAGAQNHIAGAPVGSGPTPSCADSYHEIHGFVYPEAPLRLPPEAVSRPSRAGGENHPTAMPLGPGLTPACTDSYHEAHAFFYPAELLRLPPEAVLRTPPGQALRITLALRL